MPTVLYFGWSSSARDADVAAMLRQSSAAVRAAALVDGQDVGSAAIYPNEALIGTPLEDIYGANVPRLREIRKKVDPKDVMGLTGGFKF
jgi:Berberine and berberine like